MCRQEPGANPADRRERGVTHSPSFLQIAAASSSSSFGYPHGSLARHSKKMSSPNTNFALRLRSFRWYAPPLGPAPVPPPTKVPYFAFRRVRSRNPRIDSPIPSPPPCDPSPYPTYKQPNEQQKPRWNNAWRENTKHITFDCCLLFWLPFMPLAYTERNRFVCG